jgi:predicted DNA-binding transcriptional regulator AlpA
VKTTPAIQSKSLAAPAALTTNKPIRFLRLPDVLEKTGLSKTSAYTLPGFPKSLKIKPGTGIQGGARWVEAEIDAWMQSLIQLRDSKGGAK